MPKSTEEEGNRKEKLWHVPTTFVDFHYLTISTCSWVLTVVTGIIERVIIEFREVQDKCRCVHIKWKNNEIIISLLPPIAVPVVINKNNRIFYN